MKNVPEQGGILGSAVWVVGWMIVAGCNHAYGPIPDGVAKDDYAFMQSSAARDLRCSQQELKHEPLPGGRHLFQGCGDQTVWLPKWSMPAPSHRFAKETGCDVHQTSEASIDRETRVVEGCGQRITYVASCEQGACTWIANTKAVNTKTVPQ